MAYPPREYLPGTPFGYPPPPDRPVQWYDEDAGPMVRPYALTKGRTRPGQPFDLIALVVTDVPDPTVLPVGPEQTAILEICRGNALSVAEIAADLDLPLGVVRVLLGDLLDAEHIRVSRPVPPALLPHEHILQEVIHGLRAL
ncbi:MULTISPECIES: DUF742 domain-containing protein [Kitasatospora]|jgi:hypothetical protein|uniref:DUF742 domain-containing protein n=1 Tax=Kitasatospora TaxID=2063 RepID=UPI000A71A424|nr:MULTISPECIES: DUF742 domain-containing protein [unclassified Kitasatospora]MDR3035582.1 DUF742 domain-containing protein [Kitasatospora sp.]WAL75128.1 DUF742 domain-containing protein [Kitasatospora sp. YST-16]WNW41186.1 DUF742 domain-containing protein [Streptomyces sp. Li-HN-5-13]